MPCKTLKSLCSFLFSILMNPTSKNTIGIYVRVRLRYLQVAGLRELKAALREIGTQGQCHRNNNVKTELAVRTIRAFDWSNTLPNVSHSGLHDFLPLLDSTSIALMRSN